MVTPPELPPPPVAETTATEAAMQAMMAVLFMVSVGFLFLFLSGIKMCLLRVGFVSWYGVRANSQTSE